MTLADKLLYSLLWIYETK